MKKVMIMASMIFVLASCEKTTEGISNRTTAAESDDAVAAGTLNFTFNSSKQGWTTENGATSVLSPQGNPTGCVKGTDDGSATSWYFAAPASLLTGLQTKSGNFLLKFDLKAPSTNNSNTADIIIVSPNRTIVLDVANDPNGTTWTSYSAALTNAANWRIGTLAGAKATNAQIKSVLKNITALWIKGEFSTAAANAGFLDNVNISKIL